MKRALFFAVLTLLLCAALLAAQRRRNPPTKRGTRTTKTTKPAASSSADAATRAAGAEQVANQIKNLTRFLYLFGGAIKDLQAAEAAVRSGDASREQADRIARSKQTLVTSIRNVREGLDKMEADFRFTEQLKPYYGRLQGVANVAAGAEDAANTGRYDQAGRALIEVVGQLTDVLTTMQAK